MSCAGANRISSGIARRTSTRWDSHRTRSDDVIAHTLLSHAADPAGMLAEAARALRPGGTLVVFDVDFASMTFDHPDTDLAEEVERQLSHGLVANPRVLRQMPRLLRAAGLRLLDVQAHVLPEVGDGSFHLNAALTYGPLLARMGRIPADDMQRWIDGVQQASNEGVFFVSYNFYTYLATRSS